MTTCDTDNNDFDILSSSEVRIQLIAETMYELEVTNGLTFKDGHCVKAPPFEDFLARARARYEKRNAV